MSKSSRKHSFEVRRRALAIWQKAGYNPWEKPREGKVARRKSESGDFYKGAFDDIPFLNNDAKRTFTHLLLRPGYMIRDYTHGAHERYLAPLTALIVFYAFFALLSSVLEPVQQRNESKGVEQLPSMTLEMGRDSTTAGKMTLNVAQIVQRGYIYLTLDQHPEAVDTQGKAALAAFEGRLRSQGIPLFLSEFFFLWLAMCLALRHLNVGRSACAAASAYILCQFSFFMLFTLLLSWGKQTTIGVTLMLFLLVVDYHQWLDLSWGKSLKRAVATGVWYGVFYGALILLVSLLVLVIAFFRTRA